MTKYLTILEVMEELKVCRNTLTKYIRSGGLKSYKVGRLIRIKAEDLNKFIEAGENDNRKIAGNKISRL